MIQEIKNLLNELFAKFAQEIADIVEAKLEAKFPSSVSGGTPTKQEPVPSPIQPPVPSPIIPSPGELPSDGSVNFLEHVSIDELYVQNGVVAQWVAKNPNDPNIEKLRKIANEPTGVWLTGGTPDEVSTQVTQTLKQASGKLVTFVVYNIPNRDNGGQSKGGAENPDAYKAWIGAIDYAIKQAGNPKVVFIYEPDALGFAINEGGQAMYDRFTLMKEAIDELTQNPNRSLYIDVDMWDPTPDRVAAQIEFILQPQNTNLKNVRGWALNTSGYNPDAACHSFGEALVAKVGGHYIVDTSRNGAPVGAGWENMPGAKLGAVPLTYVPTATCDGNIWPKPPGESDGADNGAPNAGAFFYDYAVALAS